MGGGGIEVGLGEQIGGFEVFEVAELSRLKINFKFKITVG